MKTAWTYNGETEFIIPEDSFGFIYLIEKKNAKEGEKSKYIGRKYLTAAKTTSKRVLLKNGTKVTKKKKSRVESDWGAYKGSCKPLLTEIEKFGADKFDFKILAFAKTKGQVNFLECFFQMRANVLADETYYNDAIGSGQFRGVKFDDEFKTFLRELT